MKKYLTVRNTALCALFMALIAIGAFIRIPVPAVPFTLQTLFVALAALLLGPALGLASVLGYVILGLAGLPIFASGGGITYVLMPSFGYILGFLAAVWVTGKIGAVPGASLKRLIAAALTGMLIIYACGVLYYWLISTLYLHRDVTARTLLVYCFLIFLPGDAASCIVAALISKRLAPFIRRWKAGPTEN